MAAPSARTHGDEANPIPEPTGTLPAGLVTTAEAIDTPRLLLPLGFGGTLPTDCAAGPSSRCSCDPCNDRQEPVGWTASRASLGEAIPPVAGTATRLGQPFGRIAPTLPVLVGQTSLEVQALFPPRLEEGKTPVRYRMTPLEIKRIDARGDEGVRGGGSDRIC